VSYGSAGQGSLTHLTMELFKQATQTFMVHLPYRGIAPAFTDLLGGQTQAMFPGLAAALPHIRSGRVRRAGRHRHHAHPLLPDVPTMIEAASRASTPCSGMAWWRRRGCRRRC
jgi:tripartite-type tricarboxylate transporter receptor subunit TctC